MDLLRQFNGDVSTKEQLIDFIHEHINSVALEKMYKGDSVAHIKDAKELIDSAFDMLEEMYGIKVEPNAVTNQAK
jgi:methyltransferase-like protein